MLDFLYQWNLRRKANTEHIWKHTEITSTLNFEQPTPAVLQRPEDVSFSKDVAWTSRTVPNWSHGNTPHPDINIREQTAGNFPNAPED